MLLVDANVLLYAANENAREHSVSRAWLMQSLEGDETLALAWVVLLAFLRLSTHPAVFPQPLTLAEATELVEYWVNSPIAVTIEPTSRHVPLLRGLLDRAGSAGNLVNDAHLAALALENGATVVSFDRDFARFEGLPLLRPS
jgi:toxin-antitoxin system PIN domain toxin